MSRKKVTLGVYLLLHTLTLVAFATALLSLDDLHLDLASHLIGELEFEGTDKTVPLDKAMFNADMARVVYSKDGNSILYNVELWDGSRQLGTAYGSHPGYFGFKDINGDGIKEILTWGFEHTNNKQVLKITKSGLVEVPVDGSAEKFFLIAQGMNSYGLLYLFFNVMLLCAVVTSAIFENLRSRKLLKT